MKKIRVPKMRSDGVVSHYWINDPRESASQRTGIASVVPVFDVDSPWDASVSNLHMPISDKAMKVIHRLHNADMESLVVGGSVRDHFLGTESKDCDIEVYGASLDEIGDTLRGIGKIDEVGKSFGVLKVTIGDEDFDISVPRRDSKVGEGHRGFDISMDPMMSVDDAFRRRDFTINAMGFDPVRNLLVDPHGGVDDLRNGVLRAVDHTTFADDPLRVMRGIQFAGRFDMDMSDDTVKLCRSLSDKFGELPKERIWGEMEKLFSKSIAPGKAMEMLHTVDWERHFPAVAAVRGIPQDVKWHPEGDVHTHHQLAADHAARASATDGLGSQDRMIVVMATALHDIGKASTTVHEENGSITSRGHDDAGSELVGELMDTMGAPRRVEQHVATLIREHMCVASTPDPSSKAVRGLQRRLSGKSETGPTLDVWARVVAGDHGGRGAKNPNNPAQKWLDRVANAPAIPKSLITGQDLIVELGMKPGPEFKSIIAAANGAQDAGDITDRETALNWLRASYK